MKKKHTKRGKTERYSLNYPLIEVEGDETKLNKQEAKKCQELMEKQSVAKKD